MSKAKVTFKPVRIAEGDWIILAESPGRQSRSNSPEKTRSFAIFRWGNGTGASHWIAYNVPASKAKLEEGEASASPKDFTCGKNSVGHDQYFGP